MQTDPSIRFSQRSTPFRALAKQNLNCRLPFLYRVHPRKVARSFRKPSLRSCSNVERRVAKLNVVNTEAIATPVCLRYFLDRASSVFYRLTNVYDRGQFFSQERQNVETCVPDSLTGCLSFCDQIRLYGKKFMRKVTGRFFQSFCKININFRVVALLSGTLEVA